MSSAFPIRGAAKTVQALVVRSPTAADPLTEEALFAWCRTRMAAYKVPRSIRFMPSLPRSGTGKVAWRELQEAAAEDVDEAGSDQGDPMSSADLTQVRFDLEHQVATLTLSCPEKRNALTLVLRDQLADAVRRIRRDADIRAVVITGAGGHFCSGGDLGNIAAVEPDTAPGAGEWACA